MNPPPRIRSVGRALPKNFVDQATLTAAFRHHWSRSHFNIDRLEELHRAVGVGGRYLAAPIETYRSLSSFAQRNDLWVDLAEPLGAEAIRQALDEARLGPRSIDQIFFVTVTGVSTPSLDARWVNRLGLRSDVKRTPLFGLGCVAGVAGTARAADALRAFPDAVSLLVSVELCSLTLQPDDVSIANVIASGLFGDGAAAVVLEGGHRPGSGPRVRASRSVFYPDTERVMGWEVRDSGFKVVLSPAVPRLVNEHLGTDVDAFLAIEGLARRDIRHWVAHTGGPRVLEAVENALELSSSALARSRAALATTGNLSSASVLFVLGDLLDSGEAQPGELGLMIAMGPGFCSELVLLEW